MIGQDQNATKKLSLAVSGNIYSTNGEFQDIAPDHNLDQEQKLLQQPSIEASSSSSSSLSSSVWTLQFFMVKLFWVQSLLPTEWNPKELEGAIVGLLMIIT